MEVPLVARAEASPEFLGKWQSSGTQPSCYWWTRTQRVSACYCRCHGDQELERPPSAGITLGPGGSGMLPDTKGAPSSIRAWWGGEERDQKATTQPGLRSAPTWFPGDTAMTWAERDVIKLLWDQCMGIQIDHWMGIEFRNRHISTRATYTWLSTKMQRQWSGERELFRSSTGTLEYLYAENLSLNPHIGPFKNVLKMDERHKYKL